MAQKQIQLRKGSQKHGGGGNRPVPTGSDYVPQPPAPVDPVEQLRRKVRGWLNYPNVPASHLVTAMQAVPDYRRTPGFNRLLKELESSPEIRSYASADVAARVLPELNCLPGE